MKTNELDTFTKHYIIAALWSSFSSVDDPLDCDYDIPDLTENCLKVMVEDCKKFQQDNKETLNFLYESNAIDEENAGHDFWLTRNHHGSGYWDHIGNTTRDAFQKLTESANSYKECHLYELTGIDRKPGIDIE